MTIQEILARIHQEVSTAVSSINTAVTNLFNSVTGLNNHFPYGDMNQVVVTNGDQTNTLKAIDVVSDGSFIVTDEELAEAKTHFVSQSTIFNSWFRFSHGTNAGGLHPTPSNQLPGTPLETNSWVYDAANSVITSTENTPSFIGFVSPDQFHRYTHAVTLNAAIDDDDYLAVIIAFIEDKNDLVTNAAYGLNPADFTWPINTTDTHIPNQHTLSLVRSRTTKTGFPLNDITEYAIVYNWCKPDQVMLANGNDLVWSVPNIDYGPNGNHTDVKIVREDDVITCYTTDWDDAPGGKGALGHPLQIDLTANPLTEKFRGSASYGYGALSQPYASYTNIYMNPNVNNIYDLRDGSVWLADNVGNYTKDPTKSYFDLYGVRRILHNPITKKTFYMRPDKQWELLSEAGNFITDITKPDPNVNTLRVFKGDDYFDIEITTGGSGSGGSGGGSATRFGIEDNTGVQDRNVDMQGFDYHTVNNKHFLIEGSLPGVADYGQIELDMHEGSSDASVYVDDGLIGNSGQFKMFPQRSTLSHFNSTTNKQAGFYIESDKVDIIHTILNQQRRLTFPKTGSLNEEAPTYIAVSVNGTFADATGNITLDGAGGGGGGGTSYSLPTASSTVLGGVKVGAGLSIDGSGVLYNIYGIPSLQEVTDAGNTSTNTISVTKNDGIIQVAGTNNNSLARLVSDSYMGGTLELGNLASHRGWLTNSNTTQNTIIQYPDVAVAVITASVNGVFADVTGNITIGSQQFADNASALAGGLAVGTIYRTGDLLKIVH